MYKNAARSQLEDRGRGHQHVDADKSHQEISCTKPIKAACSMVAVMAPSGALGAARAAVSLLAMTEGTQGACAEPPTPSHEPIGAAGDYVAIGGSQGYGRNQVQRVQQGRRELRHGAQY